VRKPSDDPFPSKERINTELLIDKTAALHIVDGQIRDAAYKGDQRVRGHNFGGKSYALISLSTK